MRPPQPSNGSSHSRAARGPFHCDKRRRDARRRTPRRHHPAKVLATRPSSGARQSGSRPRARTISALSANLLKTALDGLGRYFCSSQKKRGQRIYPLASCFSGRVDWIRTSDPLTPSQVRYQTAPPPVCLANEYISSLGDGIQATRCKFFSDTQKMLRFTGRPAVRPVKRNQKMVGAGNF